MTPVLREAEREALALDFGPIRIDAGASGIALLWFDDPGRRVNLLDSAALEALRRALDALKQRADSGFPRALVLSSGKDGQFIAGADVAEFDRLVSPAEAEAKAKEAQQLFEEIARVPYPTVAAISGPCLGGGTELALACRYRIASDDRAVSIGLPEVQLGILPGFGGTQRLPRLVGFTQALTLILSGRPLDARRARRLGLLDDVLPHERFLERAVAWTETLLANPKSVRRVRPPILHRALQSVRPFRNYALEQARKTVLKQTLGHYPAPLEILRVLGETWGVPIADGLKTERKAVAKLLFTPESFHLRRIFTLGEGAKRAPATPSARPVRTAWVAGAGTMGGEIAYLLARNGIRVRLRDLKPEPLLHSLAHARSLFDREAARRRLTAAEVERAMARIEPALDLSGLERADLVLEAIVEDLNVKQSFFREAEALAPETCVLTTNTSSLSVTAMARGLRRPRRVVGMHFFNPATRMPLVEVVRTDMTDPAALDTTIALVRKLKKTPVVVADAPGFLVNRVLMPYLGEAVALVARGVPIETIDLALREFGMPVGPLELLDEIGLDVARKVTHVLTEAFGSRMAPIAPIDRLVAAGSLGKKTGVGFYRYRNGKRTDANPAVGAAAQRKAVMPPQRIQERLVFAMVNEAALALEEGVVERPDDVDLAMVYGTGFPPFRGGLLRYADSLGIGAIVESLTRHHQEGAWATPCGKLQHMALGSDRFYKDRVNAD